MNVRLELGPRNYASGVACLAFSQFSGEKTWPPAPYTSETVKSTSTQKASFILQSHASFLIILPLCLVLCIRDDFSLRAVRHRCRISVRHSRARRAACRNFWYRLWVEINSKSFCEPSFLVRFVLEAFVWCIFLSEKAKRSPSCCTNQHTRWPAFV